jgi:hypothetical protein
METLMHDTYESAAKADADRAQQKIMLVALGVWDRALRRDECGAWVIVGKQGSTHTWGDGKTWVLYVTCRSVRHWTATKTRLSFCTVMADGDEEGTLRLHRLPNPKQAELIRDVLSIRKRAELDPADLERRRVLGKRLAQGQASAAMTACYRRTNDGTDTDFRAEPAKSTNR